MIRLDGVSKTYEKGGTVVSGLSLDVADGEFVVLVGPSGSGKSTVLKMIAGLTGTSEGHVFIGDRDVTQLPPQERDVAMVFQNYALYPHLSVRRNLEFGLRMRKVPPAERAAKVEEVARVLGLARLLDRRPGALSGGERQRVAMGRAIVRDPQAFLLDEPLSNLDAKLRVQVRGEIIQLRERLQCSAVYVTHDQVEAMTLGHRVAVLDGGRLQQVDTARNLYERPANLFVALFIGSPPMNVCRARLDDGRLNLGWGSVPMPACLQLAPDAPRDLLIGIRPSAFEADAFCAHPEWPRVDARVLGYEMLGVEKLVFFSPDRVLPAPAGKASRADLHGVCLDEPAFRASVHPHADVEVGQTLRLAFDPAAFYFFDPRTTLAAGHQTCAA